MDVKPTMSKKLRIVSEEKKTMSLMSTYLECPVCKRMVINETGLISHIDSVHPSYPPFANLRVMILFPFHCTECSSVISDLRSYLHHMYDKHYDLYQQIVESTQLFGREKETLGIPKSWRTSPIKTRFLEIPCGFRFEPLKDRFLNMSINVCNQNGFHEKFFLLVAQKNLMVFPILEQMQQDKGLVNCLAFLLVATKDEFFLVSYEMIDIPTISSIINQSSKIFTVTNFEGTLFIESMQLDKGKIDNNMYTDSFSLYYHKILYDNSHLDDLLNNLSESIIARPINALALFRALIYPIILYYYLDERSFFQYPVNSKPQPEDPSPKLIDRMNLTVEGRIGIDENEEKMRQNRQYEQNVSRQMGYSQQQISSVGGVMREFKLKCPLCKNISDIESRRFLHLYNGHSPFPSSIANKWRVPTEQKKTHICKKDHYVFSTFDNFILHLYEHHKIEIYQETIDEARNIDYNLDENDRIELIDYLERQIENLSTVQYEKISKSNPNPNVKLGAMIPEEMNKEISKSQHPSSMPFSLKSNEQAKEKYSNFD